MKDERIVKAWNKVKPDELANDRIKKKINDSLSESRDRFFYRTRLKRVPVVITLALLLLGGSVTAIAYAGLASGGKLHFFMGNAELDKNTDVAFELDDSVKVKLEDIRGKVLECEEEIAKQIETEDMLSSQSPYEVKKIFPDIASAISYVGYDDLIWPDFSETATETRVAVYSEVPKTIQRITLRAYYEFSEGLSAYLEAIIYTDAYNDKIGTGTTSYSEWFEGVDFSGETICENGRAFYVVSSSEFEDGWRVKCVYWQENNVIYTFDIRYKEVDEKKANDLVTRWMDGF